jgi:hypothetical protein
MFHKCKSPQYEYIANQNGRKKDICTILSWTYSVAINLTDFQISE